MGALINAMEPGSAQIFQKAFNEIEGPFSEVIQHGLSTFFPDVYVTESGPAQSRIFFTNFTVTNIYNGSFVLNISNPPLDFIVGVKP